MAHMEADTAVLRIGKRTLITAFLILLLLMVTVGVLTQVIPTGSYAREVVAGKEQLVQGSFQFTQAERLPVYRWFTAPFEVLASADGAVILVILFFLLAVSMAFSLLERSEIMTLFILRMVRRFGHRKYLLMAVIVFAFMLMGAVLGTFEENIALVPLMVALAYCLGWDALVGLGMCMLASCFGFTAAVSNPFSIAITQRIANLPLYSGYAYRLLIFAVYYGLVMLFLTRYARRIEKTPQRSLLYGQDGAQREKYRDISGMEQLFAQKTPAQQQAIRRAGLIFAAFVGLMFVLIVVGSVAPALSDVTLPLIGLLLLVGGVLAARVAGVAPRERLKVMGSAAAGIAPGLVLIMMAMSVKWIISHGGIMDTILFYTANAVTRTSPYVAVLLVYGLILLLELFVGSSSAKAFLVMPLIAPLSDLVGITRQTAVLAFSFGDGFSNILYPTNPVLLICLGLTVVTYPKWFRWTAKLQLAAFGLACAFLLIAVATHYGPF